jgi:hypothetical protein
MFEGGEVSFVDGIVVLFLPWETYRAGFFRSCLNPLSPYSGKAVDISLI